MVLKWERSSSPHSSLALAFHDHSIFKDQLDLPVSVHKWAHLKQKSSLTFRTMPSKGIITKESRYKGELNDSSCTSERYNLERGNWSYSSVKNCKVHECSILTKSQWGRSILLNCFICLNSLHWIYCWAPLVCWAKICTPCTSWISRLLVMCACVSWILLQWEVASSSWLRLRIKLQNSFLSTMLLKEMHSWPRARHYGICKLTWWALIWSWDNGLHKYFFPTMLKKKKRKNEPVRSHDGYFLNKV